MLKTTFKTLVLSFLMFAFIGQAMGYSTFNSCQETNIVSRSNLPSSYIPSSDIQSSDKSSFNTASYNNDLSISAPNNSNRTNQTQDDCCNDDCCDNECVCIANGCAGVMYLNAVFNSPKTQIFNGPAYIQYLAQPRSINSVFYRPPISIS